MPLNLGSSAVSLYLGNQSVNAYLGDTLVTPQPAALTLYFNGAAGSSNWANLGNWWLDSGHTVAATALPTPADSVIAIAQIDQNDGSEPTVVNLSMNSPGNNFPRLSINITVTGHATFNDNSGNYGTLTGNATFNDSSVNENTVIGNATLNDSSENFGEVTGTITDNR